VKGFSAQNELRHLSLRANKPHLHITATVE
jgi:hypothetical protein